MKENKEEPRLCDEYQELKTALENFELEIIHALEWALIPTLKFLTKLFNWLSGRGWKK